MTRRPRQRLSRPQLDLPEPDLTPSLPPESTSTVLLKTLMELKQSFGELRADLETLKQSVNEVKTKQKEIDGAVRDLKTGFKTVVALLSIASLIFSLVRYWPQLSSFLSS